MKGATLLILGFFCVSGSLRAQQLISFPGDSLYAKSPDGKYQVYCAAVSDTEYDYYNYALILINLQKSFQRELLRFGRNVEVLWSPGSTAVAVNVNWASNESDCMIFKLDDYPDEGTSVRGGLELRFKEKKKYFGNDHVYTKAVEWLNNSMLKINTEGYGQKTEGVFSFWFVYDVKKGWEGIREIKK